jgi:DDE family transposase
MKHLADENWDVLVSLLPVGWEQQARALGSVKRWRGTGSPGDLLRTLLLHVGHGCSLRTTSAVAKAAGWASMSDVALLKKLRASEGWLQSLCAGLLAQSRLRLPAGSGGLRLRLVDSTLVKEPGDTGSQWRVLYSLSLPDWRCDFFRLSPARGAGHGESFQHCEIQPGDCLLADRGFSHLRGIEHVHQQGGHVLVRLNEQNTPLEHGDGRAVELLDWLRTLKKPGQAGELSVWVRPPGGKAGRIAARLCAVRKSVEATVLAQRKCRRRAQRNGGTLRAATLEHGAWIVVLSTVPAQSLETAAVLDCYRLRWQIELAFKRLKSLADVGHLPKRDPASSRAWLYGKLLIALLSEKMPRYAAALSPWGGRWLEQDPPPEPLAGD